MGPGRPVENRVASLGGCAAGGVNEVAGGLGELGLDRVEHRVDGLVGGRGETSEANGGLPDLGLDLFGHLSPAHLEALQPEHSEPDGGVSRVLHPIGHIVPPLGPLSGVLLAAWRLLVHTSSKPRIPRIGLLGAPRG